MNNYFIKNLETEKLELHFEKSSYDALGDEQKKEVRSNFLWSRARNCWVSRAKEPNLYWARKCAEKIGLENAGKTGERLSFAEQMEQKAERAERRAEHCEERAAAAQARGEALQKPIRDMHGDIAFFTQPNISTTAGRAFTRRRERMFAAFENGFKEFDKSDYWKERAAAAQATADRKELKDRAFLCRRISEQERDARALKKNITEYEQYAAAYEKGETPRDRFGSPLRTSAEGVQEQLNAWTDRLEAVLDKLGFYQDCLDKLGGVEFSRENIKPGYVVEVKRFGRGEVLSTGPKNCTVKFQTFPLTIAYAEIVKIVSAKEAPKEAHPFKVGETFTCRRWNSEKREAENATFTIIRTTDKSITLQCGDEKPFIRKPGKSFDGRWIASVTDWMDGIWSKTPEPQPEPQPEPEQEPEQEPETQPEQEQEPEPDGYKQLWIFDFPGNATGTFQEVKA